MTNPMEINGGAVVAMVGKNCVAIASDLRLGQNAMTVSMNFPKTFKMTPRVHIGLSGLATDIQTVSAQLIYKKNMYKLREGRNIDVKPFAHMVSSVLYSKRFSPYYMEPVIAGLSSDGKNEPFICSMDLIGCINFAKDFVVAGTASPNLFGICESFFEPDLEPEDLFETVSQCLMNAVDRDALSGWGAQITIITPENVIVRNVKARQD